MEECKQRAVYFLEKEIKTYRALSLFLSKAGGNRDVNAKEKPVSIGPAFYEERVKEAKKLVSELKNPS
jgi:hypothetical protein